MVTPKQQEKEIECLAKEAEKQQAETTSGWGFPLRESILHFFEGLCSTALCGFPGRPKILYTGALEGQDRCSECIARLSKES